MRRPVGTDGSRDRRIDGRTQDSFSRRLCSLCSIWNHSHTHPFNGFFSGTTRVGRYQNGKTNLDFTEARDSEWQWHQLGHMHVCTSLQTDNHARIPPLSFLQAGCPSCRPTNSVKALKEPLGKNISKLQNAQNRVVTRSPQSCSLRTLLQQLHWLPVIHRIDFKHHFPYSSFFPTGSPTFTPACLSFHSFPQILQH